MTRSTVPPETAPAEGEMVLTRASGVKWNVRPSSVHWVPAAAAVAQMAVKSLLAPP